MKKEFILDLHSINDIKDFVRDIDFTILSDVDAMHDKYIVDARSFLGLMSLSFNPVKVRINSENELEIADFADICRKYEVKE